MDINQLLSQIQTEIKVGKEHHNGFGGYKYRKVEDILKAIKPILKAAGATLVLTDEICYIQSQHPAQHFTVQNGKYTDIKVIDESRFYIKATATLKFGKESISVSAIAREPLKKKGMDEPQVTGTASSYARKYALNGLFALDDAIDVDSMDNTGCGQFGPPPQQHNNQPPAGRPTSPPPNQPPRQTNRQSPPTQQPPNQPANNQPPANNQAPAPSSKPVMDKYARDIMRIVFNTMQKTTAEGKSIVHSADYNRIDAYKLNDQVWSILGGRWPDAANESTDYDTIIGRLRLEDITI